ncbi:MAG: bifunctional precorrin-2 dehydrogenase/sirohydrochlorin ferrochelatase [Armatimonadetes bacterium]|nr:bifunctional precorrin-2 dehydrogenase/sirohydrochlorin ferrochelatase [Armatimonadota bacterium]
MCGQILPVGIRVEGMPCLVIGGGSVAERRIQWLLSGQAKVTVVAPEVTGAISRLADEGRLQWRRSRYSPDCLEGTFLIIAATDDPILNEAIAEAGCRSNRLVNVVSDPEKGNVEVIPALHRGDLAIGISTGGASPQLAARIRDQLSSQYGDEYGDYLRLIHEIRDWACRRYSDIDERRAAVAAVLDLDLLPLIREGNLEQARQLAMECLST